MKKIFIPVIITLIFQLNLFPQNYWEHAGTLPTLTSCMSSNSEGYLFINMFREGFWRSTNNGNSWHHLSFKSLVSI